MKFLLFACFLVLVKSENFDFSHAIVKDRAMRMRNSRIIRGDDAERFAYPFQVIFDIFFGFSSENSSSLNFRWL